ncbi:hypothetical protein HRG_012895 [Hirsutella rhossiliensis]
MSSSREPSPCKRPNVQDLTPRPNRKRMQTGRRASSHSQSQSQTTESSARSGQISPQKHLKALERTGRGIQVRDLGGLTDPSPRLASFLKDMRSVARSRGILPPSLQSVFEDSQDPRLTELGEDDAMFCPRRRALGHVPDPKSVLELMRIARECHENLHAESSWNILVHSRLLYLALHPPASEPFSEFVDCLPCPSASIIHRYLPPLSPSKKVEFCIYFNLSHDACSDIRPAVEFARGSLQEDSINHTGYYPLRERPIALSIETKMTGQGWDSAALQLGVWQAAHWNFLDELSGLAPARLEQPEKTTPEFLPCILVQGHSWELVITTRENSQTVIWTELNLGSTGSVQGIYQLIHALQRLRKWALEDYWPVLRGLLVPFLPNKGEKSMHQSPQSRPSHAWSGRQVV